MSESPRDPVPPPGDLPPDTMVSYDPRKSELAQTREIAAGASTELGSTLPIEPPTSKTPGFHLRRLIGTGGFGEVWEGVQVSLDRVVAVKRLREDLHQSCLEDPERWHYLELTFQREAATTAFLEHPNIVPIHEMGKDADGRPLLAMKLVRGKPWDSAISADWKAMPPAEFLARHLPTLIAVAQAVAFAHSRGVVHRDLKPSQVMLGEFGEVLLMDWGLAMVFDRESLRHGGIGPRILGDDSASITNPAGTVAFMAPEQTESTTRFIGPWTDIYLLGGSLYYLLTGSVPHNAPDRTAAFLSAQRGIVDPPAERAPRREPPAELSAIAMRALAPNVEDRYQDVREFIAALQDYLSGASRRREAQALAAEADKRLEGATSYRDFAEVGSLADKARALDPDSAGIAALRERLIGAYARCALGHGDLMLAESQAILLGDAAARGAIMAEVAQRRETMARREKQRRALVGAAAALAILLLAAGFLAFRARVARELADSKAALLDQRAKALAERSRILQQANELRAAENALAARLARDLPLPRTLPSSISAPESRDYSADRGGFEELRRERAALLARRRALEPLVVGALEPEPVELALSEALLSLHSADSRDGYLLAYYQFANAQAQMAGRAEPVLGMGIAAAAADFPSSASLHLAAAAALARDRHGPLSREYERALSLQAEAAGITNDTVAFRRYYSDALAVLEPQWIESSLAVADRYTKLGRYSRSLEVTTSTLALLPAADGTRENAFQRARMLIAQAANLDALGRLDEALCLLEELRGDLHRAVGPANSYAAAVADMMGRIHRARGEYPESEALYREAIAAWEILDGPVSQNLSKEHANIGLVLMEAGRYPEAEAAFTKSLEIGRAVFPDGHPELAVCLGNLALYYSDIGKREEAVELQRQVLAVQEVAYGADHPLLVPTLNNLGSSLNELGRPAEGLSYLRRALAIGEKAWGPNHIDLSFVLNNMAISHFRLKEIDAVFPLFRRALDMRRLAFGPDHPQVAMTLYNLGSLAFQTRRSPDSEDYFLEALRINRKLYGDEHPDTADCYEALARVYSTILKAPQGVDFAIWALTLRRRTIGDDHPETMKAFALAAHRQEMKHETPYDDLPVIYGAWLQERMAARERASPNLVSDLEFLAEDALTSYSLRHGRADLARRVVLRACAWADLMEIPPGHRARREFLEPRLRQLGLEKDAAALPKLDRAAILSTGNPPRMGAVLDALRTIAPPVEWRKEFPAVRGWRPEDAIDSPTALRQRVEAFLEKRMIAKSDGVARQR